MCSLPHEQALVANLVEDVVAALSRQLVHHPGLLQEVGLDARPADASTIVKKDVDELTKATTVIVPQCLGVSERLQQWVGLQDLVLHTCARTTRLTSQSSHAQAFGVWPTHEVGHE